ncbi:hypothetical protein I4F81_004312 [Pyropia yezoensis]|uniref:Uncharacterized protein n=1 Tax=Pyropia yezoensis TaxID=2788 RepID=A0ACC3BW25_PYRYE|nr:hypothetical protein I4F81_004312 [Neopyropia yezoensis]
MVSLSRFAVVSEEGVTFQAPVDGSEMLLTPEVSVGIQNQLGADFIMALDNVVSSPGRPPVGQALRYCMGVGYPEDLVVCVAFGTTMFDCVYPARTARFGAALVPGGLLKLRSAACAADFRPVDPSCPCSTCATYTRSYLHALARGGGEGVAVAGQLLTLHNVAYLTGLIRRARTAILGGVFPDWVRASMADLCPGGDYPQWSSEALAAAGIPRGV